MKGFKEEIKKYSFSVVELRKSFLGKEYLCFVFLNILILLFVFFELFFILNFIPKVNDHGIKLDSVKYFFSFSVAFGFTSIFFIFYFKKYYIYFSHLFFSVVCFSHLASGLAEKIFMIAIILIAFDLIFRRLIKTDEHR